MEKIIKIATKELGIKEFDDPGDNPRILTYGRETSLQMQNGDETPWCSIFMNWVCKKAGFERSGKANARSWLKIGQKVSSPEPGDLVVYWRESLSSWKGHVGIFLGYSKNKKRIYTLGGNQANSVSISGYDAERLLEFRRLTKKNIRLTNTLLKRLDKGPKVSALQDALKMAGYECGTSDGSFGPRTEKALKKLQKDGGLTQDGVFTPDTKRFLKSLLAQI